MHLCETARIKLRRSGSRVSILYTRMKESDNAETAHLSASDRETLLLVAEHLALGSQFLLL